MFPVMAPKPETALQRSCQVCGTPLLRPRQRWYCSQACQMVAFRRRRGHERNTSGLDPASLKRVDRSRIVYECGHCSARYLGEQRCPECRIFCRRLGAGGACIHCDELVTVAELLT